MIVNFSKVSISGTTQTYVEPIRQALLEKAITALQVPFMVAPGRPIEIAGADYQRILAFMLGYRQGFENGVENAAQEESRSNVLRLEIGEGISEGSIAQEERTFIPSEEG